MTDEEKMTPEEVICEFMEPARDLEAKPFDADMVENILNAQCMGTPSHSPGGWWVYYCDYQQQEKVAQSCRELDLDALHEVEARLTEEQWRHYTVAFWKLYPDSCNTKGTLHATAEQKIAALGKILRPKEAS